MSDAIVVGSGPNGLAAATVLARSGISVTVIEANSKLGGGARTVNSPVAELVQDHCSAVHPMAPASPFFQSLDLKEMGVEWGYAPIDAAHPLDSGEAGLLYKSIAKTASELGSDGDVWLQKFGLRADQSDSFHEMLMSPIMRIPRKPLMLSSFGLSVFPSPAQVMKRFRTEKARALYLGVAAHALQPLNHRLVSGIGAGIITTGHTVGWPVIKGGTGTFTEALVKYLVSLGVKFETGQRVTDLKQLPKHDILMLDMHPHNASQLLDGLQPTKLSRAFRNFKKGPGAFKVDFAVEGGIPWRDNRVALAGTVHVAGGADEIVRAEQEAASGKIPERPFVLVGQQYLGDPGRLSHSLCPVYAYAHVPNGYQGDATEAIIKQIERFAPGFRDRIIASQSRSVADIERENENFIGGDILTGAKSAKQLLFGTHIGVHPYDTGVRGVYLCSAATPPGPGIHGMSGYNAAQRALKML